ncbi:MAG: PIN domain-containing protein [Planctomycetes bacterium]|nr:PIN domain-containing protein [Planctomycetota bacterium]
MRELVVVDVNNASVLDRYAEIHVFCKSSGISMRDNDVWIAACAAAADAILVTNDADFDRLHPKFVTRMYFPFKA